jgi:YHS domain-containing protein
MAQDPICGVTVDQTRALRSVRGGESFYFCSERCRGNVLAAPGETGSPVTARPHGEHDHAQHRGREILPANTPKSAAAAHRAAEKRPVSLSPSTLSTSTSFHLTRG